MFVPPCKSLVPSWETATLVVGDLTFPRFGEFGYSGISGRMRIDNQYGLLALLIDV